MNAPQVSVCLSVCLSVCACVYCVCVCLGWYHFEWQDLVWWLSPLLLFGTYTCTLRMCEEHVYAYMRSPDLNKHETVEEYRKARLPEIWLGGETYTSKLHKVPEWPAVCHYLAVVVIHT